MTSLSFMFLDEWDDRPGGRVVKRFEEDGVEYVEVEFENSPEKTYLFLAPES